MAAHVSTASLHQQSGCRQQRSVKADRRPFTSRAVHNRAVQAPVCHAVDQGVVAATSRRQLLNLAGLTALGAAMPAAALAAKVPKGYNVVKDQGDAYEFIYPFGWQEVEVKGQDVVYKDIIEPLESVSVSVASTNFSDITEFGDPLEVATTLADKVLTPADQPVKILNVKPKALEGRNYVEFEFAAKGPSYIRHALAVVTVANGSLYTLVTGANDRRWDKMEDKLKYVTESFVVNTKY